MMIRQQGHRKHVFSSTPHDAQSLRSLSSNALSPSNPDIVSNPTRPIAAWPTLALSSRLATFDGRTISPRASRNRSSSNSASHASCSAVYESMGRRRSLSREMGKGTVTSSGILKSAPAPLAPQGHRAKPSHVRGTLSPANRNKQRSTFRRSCSIFHSNIATLGDFKKYMLRRRPCHTEQTKFQGGRCRLSWGKQGGRIGAFDEGTGFDVLPAGTGSVSISSKVAREPLLLIVGCAKGGGRPGPGVRHEKVSSGSSRT